MGTVNNALLLEKGLNAAFVKAFSNGEDPADVMSSIMQTISTSNQEKYGWLGQSPSLVEWLDERQMKGLLDFDYTIPNKDYEATLKIDKNTQADDQLGAVNIRIQDLASRARVHLRKLFFDALAAGTVDLCYDGLPFFSASHTEGNSGTQSNLIAGTGVTVAQFKTDFISARAALRSFKDDQGEPFNEGNLQLKIYASQDLEGVIDEVIGTTLLENTTNTLKGAATKTITSRLTGNDWFLADDAGVLKPLIVQEREAAKFEMFPNGETAFMRKFYPAGVSVRRGFGYGLWQKMIMINN